METYTFFKEKGFLFACFTPRVENTSESSQVLLWRSMDYSVKHLMTSNWTLQNKWYPLFHQVLISQFVSCFISPLVSQPYPPNDSCQSGM